jgi:TATA-box binding protein (TBP) (component of TFIID and TFIIIB)
MEQFHFRADDDKVIGDGGYSLDHDDGRNLQYTGLYQGNKIVALLVTEFEPGSTERLFATGDFIVTACNAYEGMRQDLSDARTGWEQATEDVREADVLREKLVAALRKALQLTNIASDWNLDEVEIDGEMVETSDLRKQFLAALAAAEAA